jgi:hypothetical protein
VSLANFSIGFNDALQQMMLQRELQRRQAFQDSLAARTADRADQELALRRQELDFNNRRQGALDQENAQQKTANEANALGDQLPANSILSPNSQGARILTQGGRSDLLVPNTTLPSTQMTGTDLGRLTTRSVPTDYLTQSYTKLPSEKQVTSQQAAADKVADNVRADRKLEADMANATANRDLAISNAANLNAFRQATLANQAAAHDDKKQWVTRNGQVTFATPQAGDVPFKPEGAAAKLPQREDDAVVSIHQMTPLIDELLNKAQARINTKPPQGYFGTLGEKAGRLITKAEYSAGLPVSPADSERMQLASLLQVLGTVPYLRGVRNMQFINQIQQHLSDPTMTDEAMVERLQTLKRLLPGMEQAIYDVHPEAKPPATSGGQEYDYVPGQGLVPTRRK